MKVTSESHRDLEIHMSKRQARILIDMLWPYQLTGDSRINLRVTAEQCEVQTKLEECVNPFVLDDEN